MRLRWVILAASLFSPLCLHADSLKIGFELYSWRAGSNWNYAIFEGTTTARSLPTIQAPKNRLKGMSYLKGRIAELPQGEIIYWREDKSRGLRLPPKELVHEINQFAKTSHITLFLPGQNNASKASEEIESDFDKLID